MNRLQINIIIFIMSASLIGIIVVQLLWIRNAIDVKEAQFDRAAYKAMNDVVKKIEVLDAVSFVSRQVHIQYPNGKQRISLLSADSLFNITLNDTVFSNLFTIKKIENNDEFGILADDYITKPFDSEVLLCKNNAILKRNGSSDYQTDRVDNEFSIGIYHFDFRKRTIFYNDNELKLSPKESALLKLLCIHKDQVLSREKALTIIWGEHTYFTTRSMDVFITKLRKYLKEDQSIEIINIHGSGFRLSVSENKAN